MFTPPHIRRRALVALGAAPAVLAAVLVLLPSQGGGPETAGADDDDAPGSALPVTGKPAPDSIVAVFSRNGYRPGQTAVLRVLGPTSGLRLSVFRAGRRGEGAMRGTPIRASVELPPGGRARLSVGRWKSGLYYVRLTGPNRRFGYAPFVVGPSSLGQQRVAVVLPTTTWQA